MSIKTDFTFYISIYFLCSFKSIFLYGFFLILIIVFWPTIFTRFERKIPMSYTLIIYGPYGPFSQLLCQIIELPIILSTEMREHMVLPLMSSTGMRWHTDLAKCIMSTMKNVHACLVEPDHIHLLILSSQHYHQSTFVFGY